MKVEYVHKMGNEKKPLRSFDDADISEEINEIICTHNDFKGSKTFGKKGLGSPDQIEILHIIFDNGEKRKFKYFNKAIHYMMTGGENERQIFKVFSYFWSLTTT
jgi:hypothetical protein